MSACGFGGPLKPQWVSDSWRKKKSSAGAFRLPGAGVAPAGPEAEAPPEQMTRIRVERQRLADERSEPVVAASQVH